MSETGDGMRELGKMKNSVIFINCKNRDYKGRIETARNKGVISRVRRRQGLVLGAGRDCRPGTRRRISREGKQENEGNQERKGRGEGITGGDSIIAAVHRRGRSFLEKHDHYRNHDPRRAGHCNSMDRWRAGRASRVASLYTIYSWEQVLWFDFKKKSAMIWAFFL